VNVQSGASTLLRLFTGVIGPTHGAAAISSAFCRVRRRSPGS